jgi:hypothetical protein
MHETGIAKQKARTTRFSSSIEMPSDITYVDKTETSLRDDVQPSLADLPWSASGIAKSQHPPKCGAQ